MKINWKPTAEVLTDMNMVDPQRFVTAMSEAGYNLPCSLTDEDLPVLRGMAATAPDPLPYKALISLITVHDSIDLWADE